VEVGLQAADLIPRLRTVGAATIRPAIVGRLAPARRLLIAIQARHLAEQLRPTAAVLPRMVAARRLIARDHLMEEGLPRTALVLLMVEGHRPIGPGRPTVEDHRPIARHRLTAVAALRLIDLHHLPAVAPIVVAGAAPLSLTAAVGVDLEAGTAEAVDVLPPGDTEAIANPFLKQTKAPLPNTSGASFALKTGEIQVVGSLSFFFTRTTVTFENPSSNVGGFNLAAIRRMTSSSTRRSLR